MKATTATIIGGAFACSAALFATPSTNTVEAITRDWYEGRYSNVYELAQQRIAANSNDLVAAHLMVEWDLAFSSRETASNTVMRLISIADDVTNPAYTNMYKYTRAAWFRYVNRYLPSLTEDEWQAHIQRSHATGRPMNATRMLKVIHDSGLWDNSSNSNGEGEE